MTDIESKLAQNLWNRYGGPPGAFSASPMVGLVNRLTPAARLPLLSTLQRRLAPDSFSDAPELVDAAVPQPPDPVVATRQVVQRRAVVRPEHPVQRLAATPLGVAGTQVGAALVRNLAPLSPVDVFSPSATQPSTPGVRGAEPIATIQRQAVTVYPQSAGDGLATEGTVAADKARPVAASLIQRVESDSPKTPSVNQAQSIARSGNVTPIQRVAADSDALVLPPSAVEPNLQPAIRRRSSLIQRQTVTAAATSLQLDSEQEAASASKPAASAANAAPVRLVFPHAGAGDPAQSAVQRRVEAPFPSANVREAQTLAVVQRKVEASFPSADSRAIQPPVVVQRQEGSQVWGDTTPLPMPLPGQARHTQADTEMPLVMGAAPVIQTARDETPKSHAPELPEATQPNLMGNSGTSGSGSKPDVDLLVNKVLQQLMRRLAVERERKGGRRWP